MKIDKDQLLKLSEHSEQSANLLKKANKALGLVSGLSFILWAGSLGYRWFLEGKHSAYYSIFVLSEEESES